MPKNILSIGMATYDDYDGVFFSIQSLRMFHPICNSSDVEFVVLDGNPDSEHGKCCKGFVENKIKQKYIPYSGKLSSFNKYETIKYSDSKYILIIDCHVLIQENGITKLLQYFEQNSNCRDLLQGPLLRDDLINVSTHFDKVWRGDMYGIWSTNEEGYKNGKPFEIPMQGMGLLSFEKEFWPGINENFEGFGGEEGYIAEKFRLNGGKNLCLPFLGWNHRFCRPQGVKYPLNLRDRIWNYFLGWFEMYQDENHEMILSTKEHFKDKISKDEMDEMLTKIKNMVLSK